MSEQPSTPLPVVDDTNAGIYITTKDSFTLTDGPTIFLASDVKKIARFYIQQANIPSLVMKDIMDKIEFNNKINEKISGLEEEIETEIAKNANKEETKEAFKMIVNAYENKVDLTKEEKEAIGEQLKDVLKTVGIVGITLLPGGSIFLIITNFLKLNKYVLPSSFQKNEK